MSPIRNSRLVDVKYRLDDPALASRIVNAVAKNYIEQDLEYKFVTSKGASDWLGARLAEQRKQVEQAETALQRYREQNDAISLEDRENIVVQKLSDLNAAVTQAKTDRFQKEALYKQLQSLTQDPAALDSFPAILGNTYIQQQKAELAQLQRQHTQLSEKLGEKHPDIIRVRAGIAMAQTKLDGEVAKVVQSVRNEYQAALAKENSLIAALNQQKGEAQAMNRKAIDYGVLERDVQSTKQLYESLLQRAKETGVSTELKTSNIRVVDEAERPRTPVSPKKALNLSLALIGGSFLAFGLTFFFEYLDSRIKTPDEITTYLGLASLGMVPALTPRFVHGLRAADQPRRAAELRRGHTRHPDQPPVLVDRGRLAQSASSPAPAPAKARRWSRPISRSAWRRQGSVCCSSTPTCAVPGCTRCSINARNLACPT